MEPIKKIILRHHQLWVLLVVVFSFTGFKYAPIESEASKYSLQEPIACIKGLCDKESLTKEQVLKAGGIEVKIPDFEISIKILKFAIVVNVDGIEYNAVQKDSAAFSSRQLELIKRASRDTDMYIDDISADINGRKYSVMPLRIKIR